MQIHGVVYGEKAPCPACGITIVVRKTKDGKTAEQSARQPALAAATVLRTAASIMFVLNCLGLLGSILVAVMWLDKVHASIGMTTSAGIIAAYFVLYVLVLAKYSVIERGAQKMQDRVSYGWAMTAAILAIPDIFLFPIGIWALVVLLRPETKKMFSVARNAAATGSG